LAALSRFLRTLGHRVHERPDIDWVEVGALSLSAVPSTSVIDPPDAEVDRLLGESGRIAATFVTADRGVPATAWWVRDSGYGLESTQRQFRQNLRRAEGRVGVRPLSWDELRTLGLSVHRDALAARGDQGAATLTPAGWGSLCEAAEATAGMAATGCFVDATLAGYIVSWTSVGTCEGLLADIAPRFADLRPAHHLYHGFAADMIRRPGIQGVTVGRTSIPAKSSLDAFKRHAGFRPEPIRLAAVLHPRFRWWLSSAIVRRALRTADRLVGSRLPALGNVGVLDAAAATRADRATTAKA
jgi:hypothetical protein